MNLQVQSGPAHSCLTLIEGLPPAGVLPAFNRLPHRPAWLELRFQFPTGSPVGLKLGLFNLWKQVQKVDNPVDFTIVGA